MLTVKSAVGNGECNYGGRDRVLWWKYDNINDDIFDDFWGDNCTVVVVNSRSGGDVVYYFCNS